MTHAARATAIFAAAMPDDLIPHIAAHAREAELQLEETETSLVVTVPLASCPGARALVLAGSDRCCGRGRAPEHP